MLLKVVQIVNVFLSSSYFSFFNLKIFLKVNLNCHKPKSYENSPLLILPLFYFILLHSTSRDEHSSEFIPVIVPIEPHHCYCASGLNCSYFSLNSISRNFVFHVWI